MAGRALPWARCQVMAESAGAAPRFGKVDITPPAGRSDGLRPNHHTMATQSDGDRVASERWARGDAGSAPSLPRMVAPDPVRKDQITSPRQRPACVGPQYRPDDHDLFRRRPRCPARLFQRHLPGHAPPTVCRQPPERHRHAAAGAARAAAGQSRHGPCGTRPPWARPPPVQTTPGGYPADGNPAFG